MATTIAALTPNVTQLLGNRTDVAALVPDAMAAAVVELSNNYPFEELRVTGPTVQFTPGVNAYPSSFFEAPPSGGVTYTFNKMVSWWFYLQPPVSFSGGGPIGAANPGYNLVFRDIENLEVLVNTLTLPQFWSQLGAQGSPVAGLSDATFYVAACPNVAYYTYARYQWLHPFSDTPLSTDPIYLPTTWNDIIEYATAERIALKLRMKDVVMRYHQVLFGDPLFEATSGAKGMPGLIFRRTSQTQKNQSRSTRSVRLVRRRY